MPGHMRAVLSLTKISNGERKWIKPPLHAASVAERKGTTPNPATCKTSHRGQSTGKVHHGVPAALCTSPTRLLQHFGLRELAHEVTEQNRDLYSKGGKMDFSTAILCHQHKKIKTELWKRGKKLLSSCFEALGVNKWKKPGKDEGGCKRLEHA